VVAHESHDEPLSRTFKILSLHRDVALRSVALEVTGTPLKCGATASQGGDVDRTVGRRWARRGDERKLLAGHDKALVRNQLSPGPSIVGLTGIEPAIF
jgi:hypothetical protein